jgi:hypothetical protein
VPCALPFATSGSAVWRANACRIVAYEPSLMALWIPPGSPAKVPIDQNGRERRIPSEPWTLSDRLTTRAALALVEPGRRWSLWHFWEGGDFYSWYVNFERDSRRTPIGVDMADEKLDLVAFRDGRLVVKDQRELEAAAALSLLDAQRVRGALRAVLADPPWPSGWEDWRPDPRWETPRLPAGWNVVES